jgi:putative sigma-54 modulation protein
VRCIRQSTVVLDKLDVQIKKSKQKSRAYQGTKGKTGDGEERPASEAETGQRECADTTSHIEYKPMDVDEAVLQMDLIEDNFLVFTNARTDVVNVLYRQKDGNYGLIQPRN